MELGTDAGIRTAGIGTAGIRTRAEFAAALTDLRESAGLSVRDVARRSGIAASTAGGYFSGRHLPPLTVPETLEALLRALGVAGRAEQDAWVEALRRVRRAPGPRPVTHVGPYRGLAGFEPEDAEWFFGREDLLDRLLDLIATEPDLDTTRNDTTGGDLTVATALPVVVVGASGAGKSSLLRAGLVARARADGRAAILLSPGEHPAAALRAALRAGLRAGLQAGLQAARRAADPDGAPEAGSMLVVDQLEEMFTLCPDEAERQEFLDLLAGHPGPVVLGLRADFYPQALDHPWLRDGLQHRQLVVGQLDVEQVRRAVLGPASRAGSRVEPALVDVLLHEFAYEPGALPLLSHALLATWERAGGGDPTLEHYRAVGGIGQAIAVSADEVLDTLTRAEQQTARRMFLRMVTAPDDSTPTRRHVPLAELADLPGTAEVRERFLAARLITAGQDTVELAHEALVTAWPRLTGWIDADRAGLRLRHGVTRSAQAWQDAGRDEAMLYRGGRLELATGLLGGELTGLERDFLVASVAQQQAERDRERRGRNRLRVLAVALALSLLAISAVAGYAFHLRDGVALERDAAQSRQLALEAARVAGSDPGLATQLSLAAYRISPTTQAFSQLVGTSSGSRSTRLVGGPVSMQGLATRVRPDGGLLVAGVGEAGTARLWRLDRDQRVLGSAPLSQTSRGGTSFAAAFAPDGRTLALAGAGGTVVLRDVSRPALPAAGVTVRLPVEATVYALAYSPDGARLAAGDSTGRVTVWDLAKPAAPVSLLSGATDGRGREVHALAWTPDGSGLIAGVAIAAGAQEPAAGSVLRWHFTKQQPAGGRPDALPGRLDEVLGLAISRDGSQLAAGTRGSDVVRWRLDAKTGKALPEKTLSEPGSWVNGVGFSPDGRTLAAASSDSRVWLWDLGVGDLGDLDPLLLGRVQQPSPVTAVTFLDDDRIASAGTDGVARIWDTPPPSPGGLSQSVFGVDHRGAVLAAGGSDELRLWDTGDPRRPRALGPILADPDGTRRLTGAIALSPDGKLVADGNDDGAVRVWDISDPARSARPVALPSLTGGKGIVEWVAFSPDATLLAQVGDDGAVRLWDLSDPATPRRAGVVTLPGILFGTAFSPDGRTLAVAGMDGLVELLDVSDPAKPSVIGRPLAGLSTTVVSVAFAPDGRTLAAAGYNRSVQLWDVHDRARPQRLGGGLTGPTNVVYGLAFSPDGRQLAAASNDGAVWWWGVRDPRRPVLRGALAGGASSLYSVAFSDDGGTLTAGGSDGRVASWRTDVEAVADSICTSAGTPLTRAEWAQYAPGTDFTEPCP